MGNVLQGNVGQAPARQAAIFAGLPNTIEAVTINKVCASGLKAVVFAAQNIQLGLSEAQIAGAGDQAGNFRDFAGDSEFAGEFYERSDRHVGAGVRDWSDLFDGGFGDGSGGGDGAVSGGVFGVGDWAVAGRDGRISDQSGAGFGAAGGACDSADCGEGWIELELCVGASDGAAGGRGGGGVDDAGVSFLR